MRHIKLHVLLITIAAISGLLAFGETRADPIPELVEILENEIFPISKEVNACEISENSDSHRLQLQSQGLQSHPGNQAKEIWFYRHFFLTFRARGGFVIPKFITVQIIPEITLGWEREVPEDWSFYHPLNE